MAYWSEEAERHRIRYKKDMELYKATQQQQSARVQSASAEAQVNKLAGQKSGPMKRETKESNEVTMNKTTPRSTGKATPNQHEIDTPLNHTSRGRRSCPPQFYHDVVYDNAQDDRESPSRFDSPSYGLMEWKRTTNESFKDKFNENVHLQNQLQQVEMMKTGGAEQKQEAAYSLTKKLQNPTEKKNSSNMEGKKRRRSRGRNQSSSMLGSLSGVGNGDVLEKPNAQESTTITKSLDATGKATDKSVSEKSSVKIQFVKNETLSIKELDKILSRKQRKSAERAKKAAAKKETTTRAENKDKSSEGASITTAQPDEDNQIKSTKPARDVKVYDTKVSEDGRFLVTSLPSAQKAQSHGFIIRMLTDSPSNSHDEMAAIGINSDEPIPNANDAIINRRNTEYKQLLDAEIERLAPIKQSGQRLNFDDAEKKLIDHFRMHVQKNNGRYFRWNFTLRLYEEIDEGTARKSKYIF